MECALGRAIVSNLRSLLDRPHASRHLEPMFSTPIPRTALLLGFAGLLPFVWGVATMYVTPLQDLTVAWMGARFAGPYVLLSYGTIILAFMSGVLWGFAARDDTMPMGYVLSVIPALWAFFFVGNGPSSTALNLITGFLAVLAVDFLFWTNGVTPRWWMSLRIQLTTVVVLCLATIVWGSA